MRKRAAAGALAVAAMLAFAACGGDDDDPTVGAPSDETTSTTEDGAANEDFNDADVTFVQMMIVHHQQAIEMAQLADGRTESPEVLDLAARVEAAQQPEIEQMRSWLEEWGESESADSGMEHESMPGEMSEDDMAALETATGAEFDRMFLEMMIEHHRGAIEMAETEMAEGTNQEAIQLAQKIVDDQQAEILEMEGLLEELR